MCLNLTMPNASTMINRYGLNPLSVKVTSEGSDWRGQTVRKKIVNMTNGQISIRADCDDWGAVSCH